jgi:NDP-sugar pyrophosphorylase family protein
MLAVVLAAGRGKRLRPLTDSRSKPMLPIAGKPLVERVLEMLEREGVERFIVVVHPDDHPLFEHLSRSARASRTRFITQEQRLGMAHALERAAPLIPKDGTSEFILASCDNLYPQGHVAALTAHKRERDLDAVLTLLRVQPEQIPTLAVVAIHDERVTHIVEKPRPNKAPSDLGVPALYGLSTCILDYLPHVPISPRGERDVADALRLLIEDGGAVEGVLTPWRMTVTRPKDLLAINRWYLRHDGLSATIEIEVPKDAIITPPVRVETRVELGPGCRIGPEVYLETGCRVGPGATVRNALILRGAVVEPRMVIEQTVVG